MGIGIRAICSLVGAAVYGTLAIGFLLPYAMFLASLGPVAAFQFAFGIIDPPHAVYLSTGVWNYFTISVLCLYSIYAGLTEEHEGHGSQSRG